MLERFDRYLGALTRAKRTRRWIATRVVIGPVETRHPRAGLVTHFWFLVRARSKIALLVTGVVIFLVASLYGLGAPFTYGHYGYHAGEYATRARHTLRHGSILPGNVPGTAAPTSGSYYLHHPILTHQMVTATFAILGDRETSVRLAALMYSAATLAVLALLVRRTFGPLLGAFSVLIFAVVPYNIWYAAHIDHGYPGLVFVLLALLCYLKWIESERWADGLGALGAIVVAGSFDWTPFFFCVPWGLHIVATALARKGRYRAFVPCFIVAVLVPIGIHAMAVTVAHQWSDVLSAYRTRSAPMPIAPFLHTMIRYCRDLFGYPLLLMTAGGLGLALVRLFRGVGGVRALALVSMVVAMLLHLCVFREEVVTHAYRLIYFSPAVVLGTVEVIASLVALAGATRSAIVAQSLGAMLGACVVAATLPTSWRGLIESRAHGGIPNWKIMDPKLSRSLVARELRDRTKLGQRLYLHPSFAFRMELAFYLDRDLIPNSTVRAVWDLPEPEKRQSLFVFAPAALSARELTTVEALAAQYPYTRIGPYGILDFRSLGASEAVFALANGAPHTFWQAYWRGPYPWPEAVPARPFSSRGLVGQ
jgi:hypothetical protein